MLSIFILTTPVFCCGSIGERLASTLLRALHLFLWLPRLGERTPGVSSAGSCSPAWRACYCSRGYLRTDRAAANLDAQARLRGSILAFRTETGYWRALLRSPVLALELPQTAGDFLLLAARFGGY